jgi:hypothetical protein
MNVNKLLNGCCFLWICYNGAPSGDRGGHEEIVWRRLHSISDEKMLPQAIGCSRLARLAQIKVDND